MAKQYFAVNNIRHGMGDGDRKEFMAGEQVTGLPKEVMVQLWSAGVLTEVDPNARPEDDRDAKIKELEEQIAQLQADKEQAAAVEEAANRNPEDIPGAGTLATPTSPEAAAALVGTKGNTEEDADGADSDNA